MSLLFRTIVPGSSFTRTASLRILLYSTIGSGSESSPSSMSSWSLLFSTIESGSHLSLSSLVKLSSTKQTEVSLSSTTRCRTL